MRRRNLLISSSGGGGTDPSKAAPLEVAFYNGSNIVIRKQEEWIDGETPIGIVVVPGYHNRYGDGSCGVMSLAQMSTSHPESGVLSNGSAMHWGLFNLNMGIIFSSKQPNAKNAYYIPYQPSYYSTATTVGNSLYAQWPYAGTSTEPTSAKSETDVVVPDMGATIGQAFGNFNGISNTAGCYVVTRTASQWTASTVMDTTGTTNSPVAACAGRFKTVGTKSFLDVFSGITDANSYYGTSGDSHDYKGMWYLPSLGELCYLPSKFYEIEKTFTALAMKYGDICASLSSGYYWSSTNYDNKDAWSVDMHNGYVYHWSKTERMFVRAFMRL